MPDSADPRPAELARQIHEIRVQVGDLRTEMGQRFDRMPTTDIMLAYLATRDLEMKTLSEDVKELVAGLAQERAERTAADKVEATARESAMKELAKKVDDDRRYARSFALAVIAALAAIVGTIINTGVFG